MNLPVLEFGEYKIKFEKELENILSYWMKFSLEDDRKSFFGAVDLNNQPVHSANKTSVLNARILWTFSSAAKMYNNTDYLEYSNIAYDVISNHFYDSEFGGYFMELSPKNEPENDIKHTHENKYQPTWLTFKKCVLKFIVLLFLKTIIFFIFLVVFTWFTINNLIGFYRCFFFFG